MTETRKLAAILVADIVGYSRLAGADEDRILARLRTLRSDLIDPILAVHHGRVVKRTGDGAIVEFRSVVDAVRCAIEVQSGLAERNAGLPPDKRIEYRVGIHLGDRLSKPLLRGCCDSSPRRWHATEIAGMTNLRSAFSGGGTKEPCPSRGGMAWAGQDSLDPDAVVGPGAA